MTHLNLIRRDIKNTCKVSIHRWSWHNTGIRGLEIMPIRWDMRRECEGGRRGTKSLWKQKQGQRTKRREKSEATHRWWAVSGRLCVYVCAFLCVCAAFIPCIVVHTACMWRACLPLLSCVHPCMCVCLHVCALWAEERYCMCAELFFPDGTGKQTLQGWQSWHDYPVHSWHCQPPCSPLCTGARVPAASRLSSLTDWQAVYQQTYSVVKVSLSKRAPFHPTWIWNLLFSRIHCSEAAPHTVQLHLMKKTHSQSMKPHQIACHEDSHHTLSIKTVSTVHSCILITLCWFHCSSKSFHVLISLSNH